MEWSTILGTRANGVSSAKDVTPSSGLDRLAELGRLEGTGQGGMLYWKQYEDEYPGRKIHNVWPGKHAPRNKRYVVESDPSVVARCLLMTTDPGDLVGLGLAPPGPPRPRGGGGGGGGPPLDHLRHFPSGLNAGSPATDHFSVRLLPSGPSRTRSGEWICLQDRPQSVSRHFGL